jgi:type III secretion protein J
VHKKFITYIFCFLAFIFFSCSATNTTILNGLEEREANVIVVFLESKGIKASKAEVTSTGAAAAQSSSVKFNIQVPSSRSIEAMALLNQNGLPQRQGTTLLELFAKSGFMSTDKEETIRYQAGLAQQLVNIILMIDGVIDASVQLSFPDTAEEGTESSIKSVPTAAVFVKHQGVFDDPNSHLVTKIKRLVSGSIQNLTIDNVTVVSDRSRFTDLSPSESLKELTSAKGDEQVRIWSITMNKNSTGRFRLFFFFLTSITIIFALALGWLIWKMYPVIRNNGGFIKIFNIAAFPVEKKQEPIENNEVSTDKNTNKGK